MLGAGLITSHHDSLTTIALPRDAKGPAKVGRWVGKGMTGAEGSSGGSHAARKPDASSTPCTPRKLDESNWTKTALMLLLLHRLSHEQLWSRQPTPKWVGQVVTSGVPLGSGGKRARSFVVLETSTSGPASPGDQAPT